MSKRVLGIAGVVLACLAGGALAVWRMSAPTWNQGEASGTLSMRGHSGFFELHPTYCLQAAAGMRGAGVYDPKTPALAFGYFNDPDGGEWVEAQGPGVLGATRFDRSDCADFKVELWLDGGKASGRIEVVCDTTDSPGVTHVEGEARFRGCK